MRIASDELVYDCFLTDLKLCLVLWNGLSYQINYAVYSYRSLWLPLLLSVCVWLYLWMNAYAYVFLCVCSDVAALSSPGAVCVVGDDSPLRSRRHSWRQQIFLRVATPQKGSDTKGNTLLKYIM